MEAETGVMQTQAGPAGGHRKKPQGEPTKDSSWSPGAPWPCPHLDFDHLATRTGDRKCPLR